MTVRPTTQVASPEWAIVDRADSRANDALAGGWGVSPAPLLRGASYTDFSERHMSVPEGDSNQARAVRIHELTHARVSPPVVPMSLLEQLGVSVPTVKLAEEVRVNFIARAIGNETGDESFREGLDVVRHLSDGTEVATAKQAVEAKDWKLALNAYLSTLNLDVHSAVKRRLRTNVEWREPLDIIGKQLKAMEFVVGKKRSWILSRVSATRPVEYKWRDERDKTERECILTLGFTAYTLPLAEKIEEWIANGESYRKTRPTETVPSRVKRLTRQSRFVDWETLRFGMTSLSETTSTFIGKRKRPSATGKYPRRPDRLLTDPERRIFRETVRGKGGVVVFDCSGSMSVDHEDVVAVTRHFAGATVIAYTNVNPHRANCWVLAKNGRMISETDFRRIPLNGGNGVDLPALKWAVRNRRASSDFIVWVSDGGVSGKNDTFDEALNVETAIYCYKNNVLNVGSADQAIKLLADAKRNGKFPRRRLERTVSRYLPEEIQRTIEMGEEEQ